MTIVNKEEFSYEAINYLQEFVVKWIDELGGQS